MKKKYLILFFVQFLVFSGLLCLFDWNELDSKKFFSNVIQGVFFGLFMSFYTYWSDKQKEKKAMNKDEKE